MHTYDSTQSNRILATKMEMYARMHTYIYAYIIPATLCPGRACLAAFNQVLIGLTVECKPFHPAHMHNEGVCCPFGILGAGALSAVGKYSGSAQLWEDRLVLEEGRGSSIQGLAQVMGKAAAEAHSTVLPSVHPHLFMYTYMYIYTCSE